MTATVGKLCDLPIFQEGFELVAGREGLFKGVQHVSVAEVPDFANFDLGDQLFVLTTLYAFSNHPERATEAISQLCKKNVSAVAIKIHRFIDEIPSDIIKVANEYGVPLFSVKKHIAFREVIEEISSEIIDSQLKAIQSFNQQYEDFMKLVLSGSKMDTFINILGENLQCYCACVTSDNMVLAEYTPSDFAAATDDIVSVIPRMGEQTVNNPDHVSLDDFMVFPCHVYNRTRGYLVLKTRQPLYESEMMLVKQMISFMSIKFLEQYLKVETEQRMITAIVDQILFNRHDSESVIQEKLHLLGLSPQKYHCVILLSFRQENLAETLSFHFRRWNNKLRGLFTQMALFIKGSDLVAIISLPDNSTYLQPSIMSRTLAGIAEEKGKTTRIDCGVSFIVKDLRKLPDCYEQAKKALQFGRLFQPADQIFAYHDFIDKGLILQGLGSYEHKALAKKILIPIRQYDEKYKGALWETLETCIMAKTLEHTAQELHIHPSTLRYRLQRINDLTGVDFFSPEGNFQFRLAAILAKIETF